MKAAQVDAVERTTALLTRFSLSTAAPELGQRLESAGHREALLLVLEVLEMEAEAREQRKITRLRRGAQLPPGKTFETLDASTLPAPLMRKLRELARGEFLERAENALAFGLPGVGKSHAACAIGNALIEQGHSVLFRPAYQLVQELLAAKRDLVLPQKLRRLDSFELLILDDIGYIKQNPEEAEVLYQHPVGQAEGDQYDDGRPDNDCPAGEQSGARHGQEDHHAQVDREAVPGHEGAKVAEQVSQETGLSGGRH